MNHGNIYITHTYNKKHICYRHIATKEKKDTKGISAYKLHINKFYFDENIVNI